ncbi:MAG: site-2 protease family protein [Chloroflexi bacterium]|nr:site-2 protease family protein [Chloroflexota bacterium]
MSPTLVYGLLLAVLILGPLVVLHEFGHYFAAKIKGVKVLEFGFGFPPRAFGIWTGSTPISTFTHTRYDAEGGRTALRVGQMVTILGEERPDGTIDAASVTEFEKKDISTAQSSASVFVGKVRRIDDHRIVVSEMVWSINWLPFGGFVKLKGEEDPEAKNSLANQSAITRIFVIIAGIAVNAVIPFIVFTVVVMIPVQYVAGDVVVSNVMPNSPAYEAGIRPLQKIVEVDGTPINNFNDLQSAVIKKLGEESKWVVQRGIPDPFARPAEPTVHYLEGDTQIFTVVARWDPPRHEIVDEVENPLNQMRLGVARAYNPSVGLNDTLMVVSDGTVRDDLYEISLSDITEFVPTAQVGDAIPVTRSDDGTGIHYLDARKFNLELGTVTYLQEGAAGVQLQLQNPYVASRGVPITRAIPEGIRETFGIVTLARNSIFGALSGSKNPQFEGPVAVGPVGLSQLSGEVATADISITARVTIILTLAATLSISLAVINLLPFPGLDGGRLAFVVLEVVRGGRRISPEKENLVHLAGFVILLALIVVISFSDIARLIGGERFL